LDRVVFKFITESTTRVAALLAGEVDIIQDVPFDSIKLLESNPNVRVESTAGTNVVYMAFNTTRAPFNDKRVRQAVAHAIDYNLITEKQLLGYSDPLGGLPFLEPFEGDPGYGQFAGLQPFEYNPEKAKALLADAGISKLTTVIDTTSEFNEQAQVVAQMLGDIGIETSVRVWDLAVLQEATRKGERDIYFGRHGNAAKVSQWIDQIAGTGMPNNFALYTNAKFDDLISAGVAMEGGPERNALFMEVFELIMDEVPVLTIHAPQVVEACGNHVKNFYPSATGRVNLHRVDIE
jgi:peptide/nickel transport system substrate-binding protein